MNTYAAKEVILASLKSSKPLSKNQISRASGVTGSMLKRSLRELVEDKNLSHEKNGLYLVIQEKAKVQMTQEARKDFLLSIFMKHRSPLSPPELYNLHGISAADINSTLELLLREKKIHRNMDNTFEPTSYTPIKILTVPTATIPAVKKRGHMSGTSKTVLEIINAYGEEITPKQIVELSNNSLNVQQIYNAAHELKKSHLINSKDGIYSSIKTEETLKPISKIVEENVVKLQPISKIMEEREAQRIFVTVQLGEPVKNERGEKIGDYTLVFILGRGLVKRKNWKEGDYLELCWDPVTKKIGLDRTETADYFSRKLSRSSSNEFCVGFGLPLNEGLPILPKGKVLRFDESNINMLRCVMRGDEFLVS